jgi:hypothetical protein
MFSIHPGLLTFFFEKVTFDDVFFSGCVSNYDMSVEHSGSLFGRQYSVVHISARKVCDGTLTVKDPTAGRQGAPFRVNLLRQGCNLFMRGASIP